MATPAAVLMTIEAVPPVRVSDEPALVTAAAVSADAKYDGLDPADVAVTNSDNDVAGFTVAPTATLITSEAGRKASFTVRLNTVPRGAVTIALSSSDTSEGTVAPAAFLSGFNPAVSILDIPYLSPTSRVASQKLRESPFGKAILDSFSSRGLVALTIWPNGRKSMTSNKSLANLDAYKGQKFRVMDSKILQEQFAAVGASAVSIAFGELYTALQTGVVDGQENPLDTIATMKYFEVQKNLVVTEHGVMEDIVLFNPGWWKSLPANYQQIIARAFDEVGPEVEKNKGAAQQVSLETIRKAGVQVRVADEAERQRLGQAMYPRAKAAYLERAGAEGQKLVALYEAQTKLAGN